MVVQLSLIYQMEPILYCNAFCLRDFHDLCFIPEFPRVSVFWFYCKISQNISFHECVYGSLEEMKIAWCLVGCGWVS